MTNYVLENTLTTQINGQDVVVIYGRDVESKTIKSFAVKGFKPHFYVSDENGKELNCYGAPIKKIECKSMNHYYGAKRAMKDREFFNADIPLHVQYQLKHKIVYGFNEKMEPVTTPLLMPRVLFYDIEVDIPVDCGIDAELNTYPIVAISTKDTYTDEKRVFTLCERQVHNAQICCASERELLESFFLYIKEVDPDILCGWNSVAFDMPYILNRSIVNNASQEGLSRSKNLIVTDAERIPGREHVDMMVFFKHWSKPMGSFPSFGLKYISKHFANFEYQDFGEKIQTLIANNDWETLVDYSLNDVESLDLINKKAGLIKYHENLRSLIGIPYQNTIKATAIVETLLMRHGCKPMPGRKKREKVEFEGAVVIQPTVGIKHDVIFLDAKSLYPVIIMAFDLSPDIDKMIPKTITYILNEREKYRKLKMDGKATEEDETTEQSLKYIANSFYGVMGSPYFKLYDPEIASFITEKGREINASIRELVLRQGYTVVYGDTDSVAVSPVKSVEDGRKLESSVNDHLATWASKFNIGKDMAPVVKFEKYFKTLFFKKRSGSDEAAKKKYVGYLKWKDGKDKDELSYTGVDIKRSDTAPYTKTLMQEFFKLVLIDEQPDAAIAMVHKAIDDIKNGRVDVHQIAVPKGMKSPDGTGAYQKGCRCGTELFNIKFIASKKPKLIYCTTPYPQICIDDETTSDDVLSKVSVDWNKTADTIVAQKMRSLIESIGYTWNEIHGQRTLF